MPFVVNLPNVIEEQNYVTWLKILIEVMTGSWWLVSPPWQCTCIRI